MKSVCLANSNLTRINIEGNKFKGVGLGNFLSNLTGKVASLQELIIGQNDLTPVDGPGLCKNLIGVIESCPKLNTLSLKKSGLAEGLKIFFDFLKTNNSLTFLDISQNRLKNSFLDFVESLRTNTALRAIGIDENKISYGGFQSLKYALFVNNNLQFLLDYPSNDVTLLKANLKSKLLLNNLNDMLFDIEYKLKQNRGGEKVPFGATDTYFERSVDPNRIFETTVPCALVPEHLSNYVFSPSITKGRTMTKHDVASFQSPTLSDFVPPSSPSNTIQPQPALDHSQGTEMIVKFNYEATDKNEISITKGQTVIVLENQSEGWSKGKVKGSDKIGFFPTEYLESASGAQSTPIISQPPPLSPEPTNEPDLLPPESELTLPPQEVQEVYVVAIADYIGQSESELSFQTGDEIQYLEDADQGWQKGHFNGRVGYYPSGFCRPK